MRSPSYWTALIVVHYVWEVVSAMSKDRTHPESIWQTVLGRLQLQVTKSNFDAWLRATRGLELAGGTFVVSAPNALVAEVLQERLYSIVAKELETSLSREVSSRIPRWHTTGVFSAARSW